MAEMGSRSVNVPLGGLVGLMRLALQGEPDLGLQCLLRLAAAGNALRAEIGLHDGVSASELGLGIHVAIIPEETMLCIRDDGVGLDADDLERAVQASTELLAQEGISSLGKHEPRSMEEYRQAFAMSLLHLLAQVDEMIVDSLSYLPGSRPVRLRYCGGDEYTLEAGELETPGTAVSVRFGADSAHFTDPEHLPGLVRLYGDFLQFPVFWEGRQINTMSPPWHRAGVGEMHYASFLRGRQPESPPPLLVLPLQVRRPDIDIRGVLWVPGVQVSVLDDDLATVDLYWSRVLMRRSVSGMLPAWARFFRGIVDCDLHPSRLVGTRAGKDRSAPMREVLEQALMTGIRRTLVLNPEAFAAVAHQHDALLKLAALENDELFEIVADHLPFNTAAGPRTLLEHVSAVMKATGTTSVRYLPTDPLSQMATYRSRGEDVIDASHGLDAEVLSKFARHNPSIQLIDMRWQVPDFVESVSDPSLEPLLALFDELEMPLAYRMARFDTPVPAALLTAAGKGGATSELEQLFLLSQITGAMPADARGAMQRALSARKAQSPDRVVHLNLTSPVIRALHAALARSADSELLRQVAEVVVMRALILGGGSFDPALVEDIGSEMMCRLLEYSGADHPEWSGP